MSGKFPSEDYRYGLMEAGSLLYIHLHLSVRGRPLLVLEVLDLLRVGYAMVTAAGPTPIRGGPSRGSSKGQQHHSSVQGHNRSGKEFREEVIN